MRKFINPNVAEIFNNYPSAIRNKLFFLRELIFDTAKEINEECKIEETLKWNEPSYVCHGGSTIRIAWKADNPKNYAMYFHCRTQLISTFRAIYHKEFQFEGNRAIVFHQDVEIPVQALTHCISLALTYHQRKHLPLLGV